MCEVYFLQFKWSGTTLTENLQLNLDIIKKQNRSKHSTYHQLSPASVRSLFCSGRVEFQRNASRKKLPSSFDECHLHDSLSVFYFLVESADQIRRSQTRHPGRGGELTLREGEAGTLMRAADEGQKKKKNKNKNKKKKKKEKERKRGLKGVPSRRLKNEFLKEMSEENVKQLRPKNQISSTREKKKKKKKEKGNNGKI